jgi:hypothetical protein
MQAGVKASLPTEKKQRTHGMKGIFSFLDHLLFCVLKTFEIPCGEVLRVRT